jgi:hypothetical protein
MHFTTCASLLLLGLTSAQTLCAAETAKPATAEQKLTPPSQLLLAHEFAKLDQWIAAESKQSVRTKYGEFLLQEIYDNLSHDVKALRALSVDEYVALLQQWASKSDAGRVALAHYYLDAAGNSRGTDYKVTEAGAKGMVSYLQKAKAVLNEVRVKNPLFYSTAIGVADLAGDDASDLYAEGARRFPWFERIHRSHATFLHPEWGGGDEAYVAFANDAAALAGGEAGDILYATLVSDYFGHDHTNAVLAGKLSWPRAKKGLTALARVSPESYALHQLAFMAYYLGDFETAQAIGRDLVWNDDLLWLWHSQGNFLQLKQSIASGRAQPSIREARSFAASDNPNAAAVPEPGTAPPSRFSSIAPSAPAYSQSALATPISGHVIVRLVCGSGSSQTSRWGFFATDGVRLLGFSADGAQQKIGASDSCTVAAHGSTEPIPVKIIDSSASRNHLLLFAPSPRPARVPALAMRIADGTGAGIGNKLFIVTDSEMEGQQLRQAQRIWSADTADGAPHLTIRTQENLTGLEGTPIFTSTLQTVGIITDVRLGQHGYEATVATLPDVEY